jgi:NTP pyrophosphatase (non-canonical NTP hydrolase)
MTNKILRDIKKERRRQDKKWGIQDHRPFKWISILGEKFGEVCKAALEVPFEERYTDDYSDYRKELIEVIAVAVAAIENLDKVGY